MNENAFLGLDSPISALCCCRFALCTFSKDRSSDKVQLLARSCWLGLFYRFLAKGTVLQFCCVEYKCLGRRASVLWADASLSRYGDMSSCRSCLCYEL